MRKYGKAMIIPWNWASLTLRTDVHVVFSESKEARHLVPPWPSSKGQLGFESKSQAVVAVVRIGRSNSAGEAMKQLLQCQRRCFGNCPKKWDIDIVYMY